MTEGSSVQDHILKIIYLITRLGQLSFVIDGELSQDWILQSLSELFAQFVVNYHMNKLNTSLSKLLNMLKIAESHIKKEKTPLLVGKVFEKKSGFKGLKKVLNPKGGKMKKKEKKVFG